MSMGPRPTGRNWRPHARAGAALRVTPWAGFPPSTQAASGIVLICATDMDKLAFVSIVAFVESVSYRFH